MRLRPKRVAAAAALLLAGALALSGCSNDPLAEQYRAGDNKGFVAGEFATVEIAEADRGAPVVFAGTLDDGDPVTSDDYAGDVLVVNFWYAQCGPCRAEASRLEAAYQQFAGQDVAFLGINTYDQPETSRAFAADFGVTYPSVIAVDDGSVKLAFAAATPVNATPTTLVVDRQGRVAARIIGELPDPSILTTLVRDTLAEGS